MVILARDVASSIMILAFKAFQAILLLRSSSHMEKTWFML